MAVAGGNLFSAIRANAIDEEIRDLLVMPGVRIERIVSTGQVSPAGFWYDQEFAEWVVLLVGAARVAIAGEREPRVLGAGDYLFIPAHTKHRIDWTDPDDATIWLAVHLTVEGVT